MDQIPAMAAGSPGANGAGMGGDDDYQKFCSMADKYMKEHFGDNLAKYQVQPAAPGGGDMPPTDPTLPPIAKPDDDEVVKMSRQFASADQKVQVAMFQRMAQRLAAIESQSQEQAKHYSEEDAISRVARCASAGCVMDPAREKLEFMKRPLGKERDDYEQNVVKFYQKDAFAVGRPITGIDFLNTGPANGNGHKKYSRADIDRVVAETAGNPVEYGRRMAELTGK